jgi:hypothetical protein
MSVTNAFTHARFPGSDVCQQSGTLWLAASCHSTNVSYDASSNGGLPIHTIPVRIDDRSCHHPKKDQLFEAISMAYINRIPWMLDDVGVYIAN